MPFPIGSDIFMELSPSAIVLIGADGADRGTIWRRRNYMIGGFGDKLAGRSDTLYKELKLAQCVSAERAPRSHRLSRTVPTWS